MLRYESGSEPGGRRNTGLGDQPARLTNDEIDGICFTVTISASRSYGNPGPRGIGPPWTSPPVQRRAADAARPGRPEYAPEPGAGTLRPQHLDRSGLDQ